MVRIWVMVRRTYRGSVMNATSQLERKQKVAKQAILYTIAYLNGVVWDVAINIVVAATDAESEGNQTVIYTAQCLLYFFYPLQGFLDFLTYIHPRIAERKAVISDEPWYRSLWAIVWLEEEMTAAKSASIRRRATLLKRALEKKSTAEDTTSSYLPYIHKSRTSDFLSDMDMMERSVSLGVSNMETCSVVKEDS